VLIAPMFYAFLIYYLEIEKKRVLLIKVSIVFFFLELLFRALSLVLVKQHIWPNVYFDYYNNLEDVVTLLYSLFLFYKAFLIVFKENSLESTITDYDDLRWLKWFFYLGGVVFVLWVMSIFFNTTSIVEKPYSFYPLRLSSSILIYWVGYQAFYRYVVLRDRIFFRKEIRKKRAYDVEASKESVVKKGLAFTQVDEYIVKNQKFLDSSLSLESLAGELNKSVSNLSKLMNSQTESNFSDYINKYRVEEAKKLLSDNEYSGYTIVAIGLECGFNSKSAFYSAFKKFTNVTPTIYKKEATF